MRKALVGIVGIMLVAGCGGPPPPMFPPQESRPAFILEGKVCDNHERPTPGITVYLFPVGEEEPIGLTRSDSTGAYRIEIFGERVPDRMLAIFNSNRHPHHDSRFLPHMDRLSPPDGGNLERRLYYLTPASEAPPSRGDVYVIKPLCNVRAAPSTDSPVVGQVTKGQALRFLERDGDWLWVEMRDGSRGWIYRMLVTTLDHRMPE